ncbi:hypothetical protein PUN28_005555 [Cardiocondyla obscurior]|uniref:Secreted protein n=1 Tax=Cardiocondyla obscurior TaxID=286306 RepID=A0AAW2GJC0_9HYME
MHFCLIRLLKFFLSLKRNFYLALFFLLNFRRVIVLYLFMHYNAHKFMYENSLSRTIYRFCYLVPQSFFFFFFFHNIQRNQSLWFPTSHIIGRGCDLETSVVLFLHSYHFEIAAGENTRARDVIS